MPYCQADLSEPVKNLVLSKVNSFGLFYGFGHVAAICIVHHYIEVAASGFEATDELNDGRVVKSL